MAKSSAEPPSSSFPFTPEQAMEFMQKIWNPFGVTMPGFGAPGAATSPSGGEAAPLQYPNPAAMFMTLDPGEVERKIGELKVIEGWLAMSLNMMQMSIRTLELQKASLEALRGSGASKPEGGRGRGG
jgi:hypothetical protein